MTFWAALIEQLWSSLALGIIQLLAYYTYYGSKGYPTKDTTYIQVLIFVLWAVIGVYHRYSFNTPFLTLI